MGPADITEAMRSHLRGVAPPEALLVNELGIEGGKVIADLALVSADVLCGYEVKSQADTVKRLPRQVESYSRVFERCAVVCHPQHAGKVEPLLPPWWGLILCEPIGFTVVRDLAPNPEVDVRAMVELVWRDEALALARAVGHGTGLSKANRRTLWDLLVRVCPEDQLRAMVRETLLARRDWLEDDGRRKAVVVR